MEPTRPIKDKKHTAVEDTQQTYDRRLDDLNRDIVRLQEGNALLLQKYQELQSQMNGVLESTSWKLTMPLRRMVEVFRFLRPFWRFGGVELRLEKSTEGAGKASTTNIFFLKPTKPGQGLYGGWAELSYQLTSQRQHVPFFLYYNGGTGFSGDARTVLTLHGGGRRDTVLVRLPETTVGLRLDAFDGCGEFEFKSLRLRPLGKGQVFLKWMFAQVFGHGFSVVRLYRKVRKGLAVLRSGGILALRARLQGESFSHDYSRWVSTYDTISQEDLQLMKEYTFRVNPLISIIMPTYNTPAWALLKAIESVLAQTYENWELCIADDASTAADVREILEGFQARDRRIKVVFRDSNGHISEASNSALSLATGQYIAFLDHDDELAPHALFCMVAAINSNPAGRFFYSDEDKITEEGLRHNPYFKSGWNPDLFLAQNYVCHFCAIEAQLVREIGGFRKGFEGAQDWDLFLRATEKLSHAEIKHVPFILYHWRAIRGSTAAGTLHKPYVLAAQKKAVEEHLARRNVKATVDILEDISQLRVKFAIPARAPKVSIIIPTRDQVDILRVCVESILRKTRYPDFEIIIVDNNSQHEHSHTYFRTVSHDKRVRVVADSRPFNFSALNNKAVAECSGEMVAFVNNDIEVISPEWLGEMVSYAARPEVGAVGARLLYPNGLLQHGGIILGIGGIAGHNHKGRPRHDVGYFNRIILPQNLSAVTAACMVVRRDVFNEVGGFDEEKLSVAFNDVDLCLRIREHGYLNVYDPYAECYHHESVSRGYETTPEKFNRFEGEIETMKTRWADVLLEDPYYNPNLTLLHEDFGFAYPPRVEKPWRV